MESSYFLFDFSGKDSFIFQHIYTKPFIVTNKVLSIQFPDGGVLEFKDVDNSFPTHPFDPENEFEPIDPAIIASLDELGYDSDGRIVMVDLDNIQRDSLIYPEMYKKDGKTRPFTMETLPDGLYKVLFTYDEKPELYFNQQQMNTVTKSKYVPSLFGINEFKRNKISEYLSLNPNVFGQSDKIKKLESLINRIVLLEIAVKSNLERNQIKNTIDAIEAAKKLCNVH